MVKVKKRWAKRIAAVTLACALGAGAVGALVGCSSDSRSNSDEMSVAWTSNAGEYNLDPTNNYMGWQGSYLGIYEQLFRIDANFDPQPMLAESAEMVNDTTWKITIREGITFQNGNELNAQAVADCLNRTISMNERAKKSLDIASMEADGNVLTVTTNSLNTAFKNELSEPVASIIDVSSGAAEDEPVGTGPYKIDSVAGNGDVELSAYDSYWQGEPKIKTVHAARRPVEGVRSTVGRGLRADECCGRPAWKLERYVQVHFASDQSGSCPHAVLQHEERSHAG